MKRILLTCLALTACGGGSSGKNDDKVGGEEKIKDSFSCVVKVPAKDKDGEDDQVRGFDVKVVAFVYSKGSVAATAEYTYNFTKDSKYAETASRVWAQNETKHNIDTELLMIKLEPEDKAVSVYKKYLLGESFEGDCK